jgi:hypothetical protein
MRGPQTPRRDVQSGRNQTRHPDDGESLCCQTQAVKSLEMLGPVAVLRLADDPSRIDAGEPGERP